MPEIAGLRTIALLLVASFHIWLGRVSGGVDIFLFIGAYLMTRSLVDRAEAGHLTRPITFALRKFARLLPTALGATVLTVVAVLLLTAPRSWDTLFDQALAAGTYWMNFWLQGEAVNYYATARHDASFFQHFWSLSLQGQVFILWPIIHLACDWVARRTGVRPRRLLLAVFAVIAVGSFARGLHLTGLDPEFAYFDITSRLWEFALGSVLALVAPWLRFPRIARRVMSAIGLIGAVLCGLVMPIDAAYPGWPALWPIACAILIIAAADAPRPPDQAPDPVLGNRLLQRIGGYTYALYLTHWPVLILYANLTGSDVPSARGGLALLLIAALFAVLLTHLVERPVARWLRGDRTWRGRWQPHIGRRTLATVVIGASIATIMGLGGGQGFAWAKSSAIDAMWTTDVSSRGPQASPDDRFGELIPADIAIATPADVRGDWCPMDEWWAGQVCLEVGADSPAREIVVLGNSHAMMFTGMVWETMRQHPDWRLRAYGSPGCIAPPLTGASADGCAAMWQTGLDYVLETEPDLLLIVGSVSRVGEPDLLHDGTPSQIDGTGVADHSATVATVTQRTSSEVVVVRDPPRFATAPYYCGAEHGFDADECAFDVPDAPAGLQQYAAAIDAAGGQWVDLNGVICPGGQCRPTMGGLVTYHDDNHLTAPMSRALAQAFADRLHPQVAWWPENVWS